MNFIGLVIGISLIHAINIIILRMIDHISNIVHPVLSKPRVCTQTHSLSACLDPPSFAQQQGNSWPN